MHMNSRLKEVTMEEVPHIASDITQKLKGLHISLVHQLAAQNPIELVTGFSGISIPVESATTLIANARKILVQNEILT
jgi:hypothetical protein